MNTHWMPLLVLGKPSQDIVDINATYCLDRVRVCNQPIISLIPLARAGAELTTDLGFLRESVVYTPST